MKHWHYSCFSGQLPQRFLRISPTWQAPWCYKLGWPKDFSQGFCNLHRKSWMGFLTSPIFLRNGDGPHRNEGRMEKTGSLLTVSGSWKWHQFSEKPAGAGGESGTHSSTPSNPSSYESFSTEPSFFISHLTSEKKDQWGGVCNPVTVSWNRNLPSPHSILVKTIFNVEWAASLLQFSKQGPRLSPLYSFTSWYNPTLTPWEKGQFSCLPVSLWVSSQHFKIAMARIEFISRVQQYLNTSTPQKY